MNLKCVYPFTFLEFHPGGDVYCCCPSWSKYGAIGNVYKQTISEIWNSDRVKDLRQKIYDSKYSQVCDIDYCPFIKKPIQFSWLKGSKSKRVTKVVEQIEQKKLHLEAGPLKVSLAHSGTCNLRCRMCFSHDGINPPEPDLNERIYNQILPELFPDLEEIQLCGNGDPIAQKESMDLLQNFDLNKYPQLRFAILTNGVLLNQRIWRSIKHNRFESVNVSIDAATKETYEALRIGGKWETLQKNLELLSLLRKTGKIRRFYINMTVMRSNYKEIKSFAMMGIRLGCDTVYFCKIFGSKPSEAWNENINLSPEPKILAEIKQALSDPIFRQPQIDIHGISEYL